MNALSNILDSALDNDFINSQLTILSTNPSSPLYPLLIQYFSLLRRGLDRHASLTRDTPLSGFHGSLEGRYGEKVKGDVGEIVRRKVEEDGKKEKPRRSEILSKGFREAGMPLASSMASHRRLRSGSTLDVPDTPRTFTPRKSNDRAGEDGLSPLSAQAQPSAGGHSMDLLDRVRSITSSKSSPRGNVNGNGNSHGAGHHQPMASISSLNTLSPLSTRQDTVGGTGSPRISTSTRRTATNGNSNAIIIPPRPSSVLSVQVPAGLKRFGSMMKGKTNLGSVKEKSFYKE